MPHRRTSIRQIGEHTSELQSRRDLVCRLLLEKKRDWDNVMVWRRGLGRRGVRRALVVSRVSPSPRPPPLCADPESDMPTPTRHTTLNSSQHETRPPHPPISDPPAP